MKKLIIALLLISSHKVSAMSFAEDEIFTAVCMAEITNNESAARFSFYLDTYNLAQNEEDKNSSFNGFINIFQEKAKHCDKKGIVKSGDMQRVQRLSRLYASILSIRKQVLLDNELKKMSR
ncbi:hypothetical protein ACK38R_04835 [Aeromonas veronii]